VRRFPERRFVDGRWLCDERIIVDLLGVGKAGAQRKVDDLLAGGCRPATVIVAGFAGALRAELKVGDVIAVSEIADSNGNRWPTSWPPRRTGRLFTSDRMIGDPAEKLALGVQHQADVVDMESSAVAAACAKFSMPYGCVRAVSDDVGKPLSQRLMGLVESGRVSKWQLAKLLLGSPRSIIDLLRLAADTRRAAERLAEELHRLLGA
jgi:adenosylhomocysteine nucleosidase